MEISLLNELITIQKNSVRVDAIGNHLNEWTDCYRCHATISGENGSFKGAEDEAAGTLTDHASVSFTIRWCRAVAGLTTDGYRILFNGEIYDIIGLDHMSYKHKALKLRCRKVRR